jgi:hypothetical protein
MPKFSGLVAPTPMPSRARAGARQLNVDMAFVIGDFDAVHKK